MKQKCSGAYFTARYLRGLSLCCAALGLLSGCAGEDTRTDDVWSDYKIDPPTGEVATLLLDTPYLYPKRTCEPVAEPDSLPANASTEIGEDGVERLCVWESSIGTVPEGQSYHEQTACKLAFTQAPSWFSQPNRAYKSDPVLLDDPAYVAEAEWVQEQSLNGGCSCCHASGANSGNTTGFDFYAPAVWTDSFANYRLAMFSGIFDEHREFGAFDAKENHGFDRQHTMLPTTDPDRMRAFFLSEFERRGGTDAEMKQAQDAMANFFGRRKTPPKECVSPWEGIEDGRVTWNGDDGVRQFYVLESDAEIPGFPPNSDRPEGTVWAVFVNPESEPLQSGSLVLGDVSDGARQAVPADGSKPNFVPGRTYRLYATPDFMRRFAMNCDFVYQLPEDK